jgi:hypothetical protein
MRTTFKTCILVTMPFLLFIFSCKKETPPISVIPEIEFMDIFPKKVKAYQDSITIRIKYKDGDGDLGENSPIVKNCYVTDSRVSIEYPFRIKQLAPDNTEIAIQGELDIVIANTGLVNDMHATEEITYVLYVEDRAKNKSNIIATLPITVEK